MFNSLVKEDINKIISIELEKLVSRVQKMDFELEITEGATDYIASQGFDPEYGARPLKRAIQKYVEDVLTEEIIQQNPEKMSKLLLDYNKEDDKMVVVITSPPKKKVTRRKKDTDI
jgi:ATP-dependent Clp protease ATP-binding subunit ClpC